MTDEHVNQQQDAGNVDTTDTCKAKSDKVPTALRLLPPTALLAVSEIFREGIRYGEYNWEKGKDDPEWLIERHEHMLRHLNLFQSGDRSEDHIAKIAWWCLIMLAFREDGKTELGGMGTAAARYMNHGHRLHEIREDYKMIKHQLDKVEKFRDLPKDQVIVSESMKKDWLRARELDTEIKTGQGLYSNLAHGTGKTLWTPIVDPYAKEFAYVPAPDPVRDPVPYPVTQAQTQTSTPAPPPPPPQVNIKTELRNALIDTLKAVQKSLDSTIRHEMERIQKLIDPAGNPAGNPGNTTKPD